MTAALFLKAARAAGFKIATAESCTGGLLAAELTGPAGASTVFERGWVTYSNEAKVAELGVRQTTLDAFGAVSEEVAAEMAAGARRESGATVALSVTGVAGPGRSERKAEGHVCFGVATAEGTWTQTVEWGALGREAVRARSVAHAVAMLVDAVEGRFPAQRRP